MRNGKSVCKRDKRNGTDDENLDFVRERERSRRCWSQRLKGNKKRKTMLGTGCGKHLRWKRRGKGYTKKGLDILVDGTKNEAPLWTVSFAFGTEGNVNYCSLKEFQESELEKGRWDELMEPSKLETGLMRRTSDGLKKGKLKTKMLQERKLGQFQSTWLLVSVKIRIVDKFSQV